MKCAKIEANGKKNVLFSNYKCQMCICICIQLQREARIITGLARHVIPKVGEGVQTLDFAYSKSLTSGIVSIKVGTLYSIQAKQNLGLA